MKKSANFDGNKFINPAATRTSFSAGAYVEMTKRWLFGKEIRIPKTEIPIVRPSFQEKPPEGLVITWLGHSTVLIEIDGKRVLTDPIFEERCSPTSLVGPKRFHPAPISLDALPALDAVIISHDHYDHLEKKTVLYLAGKGVRFYMPCGVGAHLKKWGIPKAQIFEMNWWDQLSIHENTLQIFSLPARHFSGRGFKANKSLWASWAIIGPKNRVFFSGDTGPFDGFGEIGKKLGPFNVTLIKIGAYDKLWPDIHLTPKQAVEAHLALQGDILLPIHWGTFTLAFHDWFEPASWVTKESAEKNVRLVIPRPGEKVDVAKPPILEKWWEVGLLSQQP